MMHLPKSMFCRWCRKYDDADNIVEVSVHPRGYRCLRKPHVSLRREDGSVLEIDPDLHDIQIIAVQKERWSENDLYRFLHGEQVDVESKSYYKIFVEQIGIASGDVLQFSRSNNTLIRYHIDHVDPVSLQGICYIVDLMGKVEP